MIIDVGATLVIAHSDKERAALTFKRRLWGIIHVGVLVTALLMPEPRCYAR